MTDKLPPRVAAQVKRILDREAQRLLDEGYRTGPDGALVKPEVITPSERNHTMSKVDEMVRANFPKKDHEAVLIGFRHLLIAILVSNMTADQMVAVESDLRGYAERAEDGFTAAYCRANADAIAEGRTLGASDDS